MQTQRTSPSIAAYMRDRASRCCGWVPDCTSWSSRRLQNGMMMQLTHCAIRCPRRKGRWSQVCWSLEVPDLNRSEATFVKVAIGLVLENCAAKCRAMLVVDEDTDATLGVRTKPLQGNETSKQSYTRQEILRGNVPEPWKLTTRLPLMIPSL